MLSHALYVLMGLVLCAAAHHAMIAVVPDERRAMHVWFAACSALTAGFILCIVRMFHVATPEDFVVWVRHGLTLQAPIAICLLSFIAAYTGAETRRRNLLLSAAVLIMVVVNLAQPHSAMFRELPQLRRIETSWGETLMLAAGADNAWYYLYGLIFFCIVGVACLDVYRHYQRRPSGTTLTILLALALFLVISTQGLLARIGLLPALPLGPFGYALLPLAMSLVLRREWQVQTRLLHDVIDSVPALVSVKAADGRYLLVNQHFCARTGRAPAQLLGRTARELSAHSDDALVMAQDAHVLAERRPLVFEQQVALAGASHWFEALKFPLHDAGAEPTAVCTVATDITERKRVEDELERHREHLEEMVQERTAEVAAQRDEIERLANHDALTGLPTLRLARERLALACQQARRAGTKVALMFIDLDGFKAANDSFGHDAGDAVLKAVAARLTATIRGVDTAARQGGDEFLVLLADVVDAEAAGAVAAKLGAAICVPIEHAGQSIRIGASIGIALFPEHAEDPAGLLKAADQAMYRVKKSGKNGHAMPQGDCVYWRRDPD